MPQGNHYLLVHQNPQTTGIKDVQRSGLTGPRDSEEQPFQAPATSVIFPNSRVFTFSSLCNGFPVVTGPHFTRTLSPTPRGLDEQRCRVIRAMCPGVRQMGLNPGSTVYFEQNPRVAHVIFPGLSFWKKCNAHL